MIASVKVAKASWPITKLSEAVTAGFLQRMCGGLERGKA